MLRVLKDWDNSAGLQFFSAITILLLAVLMFLSSSGSFEWRWESLMTWLAALMAIKGVATLFPKVNRWKVKMLTEARMPIAGFAALVFALALVYIDTQVL
jgi:hypothetical protein